jgi:O-antigen/teichoic acid export membrane protein
MSLATFGQQARAGIQALLLRQVALQALSIATGVVLARILSPVDFGLFGITTFVVALFGLLGDVGITASFIQTNREVTTRSLRVAFTLQQFLVTIVVAALWLLSGFAPLAYPESGEALIWLVRAMAFSLYLGSWQAMGVIVLERSMLYKRIAVAEVAEVVVYQLLAVSLALSGYGVWSLIWAVLARKAVGTGLLMWLSRWRPGFAFDLEIIREVLRFGLPYQAQAIVGSASGWVAPTLVASLIGADAVGFLTWAGRLAEKPTFVLTSSVVRVSFAHFSRIQTQHRHLVRHVHRYISRILPVLVLWVLIIVVAGEDLVRLVYTDKWLPALPALKLFAAVHLVSVPIFFAGTALASTGRVRLTFRLTLVQVLAQVLLSVVLVLLIGFNGVPAAALVVSVVMVPVYVKAFSDGLLGRLARQNRRLVWPSLGALGMGLLLSWLDLSFRGVGTALGMSAAFLGLAILAGPPWIRAILRARRQTRSRSASPEPNKYPPGGV